MDVTDEDAVKEGAKRIEGMDGKLDILVNKCIYNILVRPPPHTNAFVVPELLGPFAILISSRRNIRQVIPLNPRRSKIG